MYSCLEIAFFLLANYASWLIRHTSTNFLSSFPHCICVPRSWIADQLPVFCPLVFLLWVISYFPSCPKLLLFSVLIDLLMLNQRSTKIRSWLGRHMCLPNRTDSVPWLHASRKHLLSSMFYAQKSCSVGMSLLISDILLIILEYYWVCSSLDMPCVLMQPCQWKMMANNNWRCQR